MMRIPSPQTTEARPIPAPVGGINALANLMAMPPEDCITLYNYIPQTTGLKFRKGYQTVGYGFSGVSAGVRTLIPYEGTQASKDRLFACTLEGIYNISTPATSYSIGTGSVAWGTKSGNAGYCTYVSYTTIADRFLLVADETNGLYKYTESTDSWAAVTGLTGDIDTDGYDGDDIVFVTVWKQRVWLVLRNSGTAYFLEPGLVGGDATRINFGNKFLRGGFLHSIHNFTKDGGTGPDDYLIAVSSSGDLVAYQGYDPNVSATFEIVGAWYVGQLPTGRNIAVSSSGDLYLLCAYGLVSLAQVLQGTDPQALPAYITGKITPLVRSDIAVLGSTRGWNVAIHPTESLLIITVPGSSTSYTDYKQYVMNMDTRAWTMFIGMPMNSVVDWQRSLYFGGTSGTGTVYKYTGNLDGIAYDGTGGDPIDSYILTAYAGSGRNVRVHFVKPQFISKGIPIYKVGVQYDFDTNAILENLSGAISGALTTWSATWGSGSWGESSQVPVSNLRSTSGVGKFAALTMTAKSAYEGTLIGFTAMADTGGLL